MTALTVLVQHMVIIPITLALHALRTARLAILILLTQFNNAQHVTMGIFLMNRCKTANLSATLLLSLTGIQGYVKNVL